MSTTTRPTSNGRKPTVGVRTRWRRTSGGGTGGGEGGQSRRVNEKKREKRLDVEWTKNHLGVPAEGTRSYDGLATTDRVGPKVQAHTTVRSTPPNRVTSVGLSIRPEGKSRSVGSSRCENRVHRIQKRDQSSQTEADGYKLTRRPGRHEPSHVRRYEHPP